MPNPTITPAVVSVSRYGELAGDPKRRAGRALRVCVDGQHAGFIELDGQAWRAIWQRRVLGKSETSEHAAAEDALRAVLASGFARRLGARPKSPVYWSAKARGLAGQARPRPAAQPGEHKAGDRISVWMESAGERQDVIVVRVNRKTVTVLTDHGPRVRVSLADVLGPAGSAAGAR